MKQLYLLWIIVMFNIKFSSYFAFKEGKLIYITPSLDVPCLVKPCLTLSQFVANAHSLTESHTMLVVLPGKHKLTMNLLVSDIKRFSMISNSSLEQSHFKIICYQNVSFQFDNIHNLWIRGLKFIGCGTNLIMSVSHFTVESFTFKSQRDSGTALWIIQTMQVLRAVASFQTKLAAV